MAIINCIISNEDNEESLEYIIPYALGNRSLTNDEVFVSIILLAGKFQKFVLISENAHLYPDKLFGGLEIVEFY